VEVVAGIPLTEILARVSTDKNQAALAPEEGISAKNAILSIPLGLAFDAQGNLYVTEGGDRNMESMAPLLGGMLPIDPSLLPGRPPRVRKITPEGVITTIAGPGGKFFTQSKGEEALYVPMGIAITPDGRLAFTDIGANLVRILPAGSF
jgi:DNA-binding beta-propeller fold protein YncE